MNNTFDDTNASDFESNLNTAIKLTTENTSYDEIIAVLNSDKIFEKQIAILKLNEVKNKTDAEQLVSNLVGQDGKVREAVAFKINELCKDNSFAQLILTKKNYETLLQGIMDINGNVCRQVIELTQFAGFKKYLCQHLPKELEIIWAKIKNLTEEDKKYVISKRNFQLYWTLEALFEIIEEIDLKEIKNILTNCAGFYDYTIREKVAKILAKTNYEDFAELKNRLKNDENYYVRRYLEHHR